ncbi:MAG TPA: ABC transporter ATP-binding protein [Anaeromyxobacteraceae bacterium]|nr:ABC transporter ATP-binding protein [Anaeromyxobacteraceae bacterium]
MLEVRGLEVRYGEVSAVRNVALEVGRGEIATVIGPNGAGKTTLLSAVAGLVPSAAGEIVLDGTSIAGAPVEENVARGLALVAETRELFSGMSVEDNLVLGAFPLRRAGRRERASLLEEVFGIFPRLRERRRQLAGTLSGGERQMLALGRALMSRPRLLLLDEPSLGLAPIVVREIFHVIVELRRRGASILLVEQNARAALQISDRGYVLETGEVTLEGPARELAGDPRVVETYLGLGEEAAANGG